MHTDTNLRSNLIRLAAALPAEKRAPLLQILACDHDATKAAGGECCGKCTAGTVEKTAAPLQVPGEKMQLSDAVIQVVGDLRHCMVGKFGPVGQQALSNIMALVVEVMNGQVLSPDDRDLVRARALAHAHKFLQETKFVLPVANTGMPQPMRIAVAERYLAGE